MRARDKSLEAVVLQAKNTGLGSRNQVLNTLDIANRTLRRLSLCGAGIGRAGTERILEAATSHPALSELQLDLPLSIEVRENLARDRDGSEWIAADEVSAIRSVYRTARKERKEKQESGAPQVLASRVVFGCTAPSTCRRHISRIL